MKPTYKDCLDAACKWRGEHHGIEYELSWHGRSDHIPQGIWCWYLILTEQQFYPDDWAKLRLERQDSEMSPGSWHRTFDYNKFPYVDPHGGWTYGEMTVFLGKDGKEYEQVKVGCDYAHSWDRDGGYWQGREDVERDCRHSIELLCKMFPRRRERCGYSGKYDDADQFYTAMNGARVHVSHKDKLKADGWDTWLPAETAAA